MILGIVWLLVLVNTIFSYVVMVATSSFYFDSAPTENGDGSANVSLGFKFALIKNFGSLCIGSFIMSSIQVVKLFMMIGETLERMTSKDGDDAPSAVKAMTACCRCCICCCENIFDMLSS